MSADNMIGILQTPKGQGFEYRVAYQSAVENYKWPLCSKHGFNEFDSECDECLSLEESQDPDVWIKNAREMWKNCKVFTNQDDALMEADRQYKEFMKDDFSFLEYGICDIHIPREF